MRFQRTNWSCGPSAMMNAFRCLGIVLSDERIVARLCNTTKDGTDDFDMASAVVLMGYDVAKTQSRADVEFYLAQGRPVMVVAYEDTHWVTIVGMLGKDKWVIVDPDNAQWNKKENGCYVAPPEFIKAKEFMGIAILEKHRRVPRSATSRSRPTKPKRPSRRSS